jgi:uncharacterized integral membrane protein
MRLGRKLDRERVEEWQPHLYLILIGLVLVVAYLIAFVVENDKSVSVHWVFFTVHTSLIWVIIVTLAIGILVGVALSQLHRRRRRRRHAVAEQAPQSGGEPPHSVGDLGN